jgi:hypothetical protein
MPLGAERRSVRDRMAGTRVMREPAYRARRWPLAIAATALTAIWGVFAALDDGSASSTSSPAASPAADYTAADRLAFVKGCAETGEFSRTECGCAFDRIRQRLSYAEFREADRQDEDKWSPRVNRALRDAFRACARDSADTNPA